MGLTVNADTTTVTNFVLYFSTTTLMRDFPEGSTFYLKVYDSGYFLQRTIRLDSQNIKTGGMGISWDGKNEEDVNVNYGDYIAEIMAIFDEYIKVTKHVFTISSPEP